MLHSIKRPTRRENEILKLIVWFSSAAISSVIILVIATIIANWLAGETGDRAAWTQAVGAIFAIVAGFAATLFQLDRQKAENKQAEAAAGVAAFQLAHDALEGVTDRLEAALTPSDQAKDLALRGARSRELVGAMREFDTARLPNLVLPDFIRLRSLVAAINARLTEVYESEENLQHGGRGRSKTERRNRLESAVKAHREAIGIYHNLRIRAVETYSAEDLKLPETQYVLNYQKTPIFSDEWNTTEG